MVVGLTGSVSWLLVVGSFSETSITLPKLIDLRLDDIAGWVMVVIGEISNIGSVIDLLIRRDVILRSERRALRPSRPLFEQREDFLFSIHGVANF